MQLTLREIAENLNLSMSTISRVINRKSVVSKDTRQRVEEYLRDHDCLAMLNSKSDLILHDVVAVVIPDISENYFSNVVRSIENNLWQKQIGMLLCDSMENATKEFQYMNMLIERNFSGIILATVDKDAEHLAYYHQKGLNLVYFDNQPNISLPFNAVINDNIKASRLAINLSLIHI